MADASKAFIGLGSNIGDREDNIKKALRLLKERCRLIKLSSLYETEPVGYKDQRHFLNAAAEIETGLEPKELLDFLQGIEKKMGRAKAIKDGPRIIDLDILFYGSREISESRLIIPHPRLHERIFVLAPLKEIAPGLIHPILKKTIRELASGVDSEEKVRLLDKRL